MMLDGAVQPGLRAGLQGRVSEDDSGRERSSGEQIEAERKVCDAFGWIVAEIYAEKGSASRFARTARADDGWPRLLADLCAGKLDVILLWESSRGDRKLATWATFLDECRARGVLIHVVTHHRTYDIRRARDWRSLAEDGVDSAYESEKTSERLLRAMEANAVAGIPHGRVPFGFERIYDSKTKKFVEQRADPVRAPITAELTERVAAGESLYGLRNDMEDRGVPTLTGASWRFSTIRQIVLNPANIGIRVHHGKEYLGIWDPIVDANQYYAAKRILTAADRRSVRPGRAKYLVSSIGTCDVCGGYLGGLAARWRPKRKEWRQPGYLCAQRACVSASMAAVDATIGDLICARLARPDVRQIILAAPQDEVAQRAREEAAKLRARLDEWYDAGAAGEATPEAVGAVERKLLPQIAAADKRAEQSATPAPLRALLSGVTAEQELSGRWQNEMTVAAKREAIRLVMDIRLKPANRKGRAPFDPSRLEITWKGDLAVSGGVELTAAA